MGMTILLHQTLISKVFVPKKWSMPVSQPRDYWSTKPSIPVGTRILRIVCDFIDTQMSRVVPKANAGIELSANYTYTKKFFCLAKKNKKHRISWIWLFFLHCFRYKMF